MYAKFIKSTALIIFSPMKGDLLESCDTKCYINLCFYTNQLEPKKPTFEGKQDVICIKTFFFLNYGSIYLPFIRYFIFIAIFWIFAKLSRI